MLPTYTKCFVLTWNLSTLELVDQGRNVGTIEPYLNLPLAQREEMSFPLARES